MVNLRTMVEIGGVFLRLGCTSFGGPVAHLGYLRDELVGRRRWLDDAAYADLVALCQCLPGPASSQVVFGLGLRRGGVAGGLLASAAFTGPSALLMILAGYGLLAAGDVGGAGWLHGLKLAAAAVVAHAVWSMGRRLCPDGSRLVLALAVATALLMWPGALLQIGAIVMGAIAGVLAGRRWAPKDASSLGTGQMQAQLDEPAGPCARRRGLLALGVWAALLVAGPLLVKWTGGVRSVAAPVGLYRAGSLVFGGGHVVLPLLRAEVVAPGWVDEGTFVAGYGLAQAVPGPLFSFSAFLGTVMHARGSHAWIGGVACLLSIFLPAWLLVGGALPWWDTLRARPGWQAALRGTNAAVVGLLLAAFVNPVAREAIGGPVDVAVVLGGWALLAIARWPAWAVVALAAGLGWLAY